MKAAEQIETNKLIWLCAGVFLACLTHWQRLPVWIPVVHTVMLLLRFYFPYQFPVIWHKGGGIINGLRLLVLFAGTAGIYGSYGSLTGREVGIALLVVLAGLKIFETRDRRDFYVSTYMGYFLVISNFFYTQTIPTAIYMLLVIIIMTTGLVQLNDVQQQLSLLKRFRLSSGLILQSIPVLLILFVLFPRVEGPLWGLPEDAYTGITGIDDQMTPGTISKLVQSNAVAFRVSFDGDIPAQSELYWRVPVLWQTDGRKWTPGRTARTDRAPEPLQRFEQSVSYNVTQEPTNKKWIFGLEMVASAALPEKTYLTKDRQLKHEEPLRSRKAFQLTSYRIYQHDSHQASDLERALVLPEASHAQTKAFGQQLREQYQQPGQISSAALDWLRTENFVYTLTPPLTSGDHVDEFLFNTRQGFCEHYAAAFTVLMRSAGIPARIVTGYQGGEINPLGDYLIVRQRDAHAWTEVWLEGRGWTRIDPTSVVSPGRVNEGIESAIPDAVVDVPLNLQNYSLAVNLWQRLRYTVVMVNYQWAQWVLGYGPERQQLLMQLIGFGFMDWKKMTLILLTMLMVSVGLIGAYLFYQSKQDKDPVVRYYRRF
mgnify:CR=1 FL=1